MRFSVVFAAVLAASADAAVLERRQRGNPDGTSDVVAFMAGTD
jgi:hypothetical protein